MISTAPTIGLSNLSSYSIKTCGNMLDTVSFHASQLAKSIAKFPYKRVFQQETHLTFGQIDFFTPTEEQFQPSIPEIRLIWAPTYHPPKWAIHVQNICIEKGEDAALKEISLVMGRMKAKGNFLQLSTELSQIEVGAFPDIVLISLLRNTFSFRSNLPSWNELLSKTERILRKRNREPRQLLRGLKKYS
jgi:hypothetical protein